MSFHRTLEECGRIERVAAVPDIQTLLGKAYEIRRERLSCNDDLKAEETVDVLVGEALWPEFAEVVKQYTLHTLAPTKTNDLLDLDFFEFNVMGRTRFVLASGSGLFTHFPARCIAMLDLRDTPFCERPKCHWVYEVAGWESCGECDKGRVPTWDGEGNETGDEPCKRCDGTGFVPAKPTVATHGAACTAWEGIE